MNQFRSIFFFLMSKFSSVGHLWCVSWSYCRSFVCTSSWFFCFGRFLLGKSLKSLYFGRLLFLHWFRCFLLCFRCLYSSNWLFLRNLSWLLLLRYLFLCSFLLDFFVFTILIGIWKSPFLKRHIEARSDDIALATWLNSLSLNTSLWHLLHS